MEAIQDVINGEYQKGHIDTHEATVLKNILENLFQYEYASKYKELGGDKIMRQNWLNLKLPPEIQEIQDLKDKICQLEIELMYSLQRAHEAKELADEAEKQANMAEAELARLAKQNCTSSALGGRKPSSP